ncbi:HAMP domain-containing protein, partial [Amycolatopsis thailandensis]|uniref:HAMP domain-containing protein n=1 Tax=Amycolatopsis thailandensis TaxID=589330 RepID=UPI00363BCB7F
DLSQKITVDARGEILELKNTINTMVDQLSSFADEVTRVAREVGTEGALGGQAQVPGVAGTWRDLTTSVNFMAGNLTAQVRSIAQVATAVAKGDLSQKITVDARGEILELKDTINTMVGQLSSFADEVTRVAREVGTEGRLGGQADVKGVSGTWKGLTMSVNVMADNLTDQVRSIAQVATAVARGDLSQKITVEAKGEVAALAQTINTMVDTLSAFADEVTRVAREVGTEGILGGQARVPNVAGTWKDLTDNVNSMANNLTGQVRNIAQVTTAVAQGDLSRKIDVDARGEILELKTTINTMVDQLSAFAAEVTRVAREVGSEGRLGGQAEVEGVSGTWKRLTENVNELAGNLTRQVRAIAEVTSAVATGDLTRSISVEAQGEVAELKDNINAMVQSLRETTRANEEQDWLNTNLARISGLMQGHRDLRVVATLIMNELTPLVGAQHGTFFLTESGENGMRLRLITSYGHSEDPGSPSDFAMGQSLIGQAAQTKKPIVVDRTPPDFVKISSSLGSAPPVTLIVLPIVFEDQVLGVIELASFGEFTAVRKDFLEQLMETIGVNVNTIIANARTDSLLEESQRLAQELQARSEELQAQQAKLQVSNAELEEKAELLAQQNRDIEVKNFEIEQARQEIEERAQQLALASKYKSEFLANMSHELRTPLTSLLILAGVLSQNSTQNLTPKQVEFAKVIQSAGTDLLQLINDILDLSKVEAGKMDIHHEPFPLRQLLDYVGTTFRPLTAEKGLDFQVTVEPDVPELLFTDEQRLRQVLRNLLSNAVKFTEDGSVELRVKLVDTIVWSASGSPHESLVAFSVIDTGIGIAEENLDSIFGAFQQADGTTSRKYGGTGLGLSISREVAYLLGGEIRADSVLGTGSTFTLYLPVARFTAHPGHGGEPSADNAEAERRVLVVESEQNSLLTLLARGVAADVADSHGSVQVRAVASPAEAFEELKRDSYRCVVLDTSIPGTSALTFLKRLAEGPDPVEVPVLAYATRKLSAAQDRLLHSHARVHPVELLPSLDTLRERIMLHISASELEGILPLMHQPEGPPATLEETANAADPPAGPPRLQGRKVLLVDDDARNVFAISGMLELHGLSVVHAPNGRKGIEQLLSDDDIDLILMDVMMPEMDGHATTAAIREMPKFAGLPIITVTAKAMEGDREKSLAAGASDYVTKPVNAEELLACMERWLAD